MNNTVSRRQMLRASTFALAAPVAASFQTTQAHAQSSPSGDNPAHFPFSSDLWAYAHDGLFSFTAKAHLGTITQSDLLATSSQVQLLAHHLEQSGLDPIFRTASAQVSNSHIRLAGRWTDNKDTVSSLIAHVRKHDPTFSAQNIPQMPLFEQQDIDVAKAHLSKVGISGAYHDLSLVLRAYSLYMPTYASADLGGIQHSRAFKMHMPREARLLRACIFQSKKQLCDALNNASVVTAILMAMIGVTCAVAAAGTVELGGEVLAFCLWAKQQGLLDEAGTAAAGIIIMMINYLACSSVS